MQLKALHQRLNRTMIYVTHDQTEALTFADQVVVMYDGYVVQMGTPQQLFEQPEHTFVGYFIGSPGMNLLPVQVDGNTAHLNGQSIPLNTHYAPQQGAKLELGIRPEFTQLSPSPTANSLPVTIKRIEDIGRHKIVRADYQGQEVNILVPEDQPVSTDYHYLNLDPKHIHLYANGRRLKRESAA